ncbi:MAG: HAMP domain-containing protein [Pyrinomonadaceae bacterium]
MQFNAQEEVDDDDAAAVPRKRGAPWLLGGLVLLLLFIVVAQQALGLWLVVTPDTAFDTLLLYALSSLNFAAFIVFSFIFVRNLLKLRSERRAQQIGSKITTRLVVYFIAVSLLPITAMAAFSFFFLNRSLDKWFSGLPEEVVSEARAASQRDRAFQTEDFSQRAEMVASLLGAKPELLQDYAALERVMEGGRLAALEIVAPDGEIKRLRRSDLKRNGLPPDLEKQLARAHAARAPFGAIVNQSENFEVAAAPLSGEGLLIVAGERRVNKHLAGMISGAENFETLRKKQRKIRLLGLSILGLLTLLLVFASTWVAMHLARGIATQIKALAVAADEVARGNLAYRVSTITDDELALLASSFNQMTEQLAENRRRIDLNAAELHETNLALEERRTYIETVLETLSTGVISLDSRDRVTTINAAALAMLGLEGAPATSSPLTRLTRTEDFAVLTRLIRRARRAGSAADQAELGRAPDANNMAAAGHTNAFTKSGEALIPVAITATALNGGAADCGVVLVLEDLSELLAAQRAAAWSEVARRMAHEIKNPLTPIQLSAERVARTFQRFFAAHDADAATFKFARVGQIVNECTATITREVASLKAMVDEFSRFARLPQVRPEPADLNTIIKQAVALYEDRLGDVRLDVRLAPTLPEGLLDGEQLRRVFINLIDNSLEALAETTGELRVTVASAYDPARALLRAEVADTGHGIATGDLPQLFQPYFHARPRHRPRPRDCSAHHHGPRRPHPRRSQSPTRRKVYDRASDRRGGPRVFQRVFWPSGGCRRRERTPGAYSYCCCCCGDRPLH